MFFSLASYFSVTECKLNIYGVASHVSLVFLELVLEYGSMPKGYDIVACSHYLPTFKGLTIVLCPGTVLYFLGIAYFELLDVLYILKHWRNIWGVTLVLTETLS